MDYAVVMSLRANGPIDWPCMGTVFAGPFKASLAARNRFNSGVEYEVWILRLDKNPIPECIRG